MANTKKLKLKIIPLGGLEAIGMNITAFEYEDSIIGWIAVWHSRKTICMVLICAYRILLI